MNDFNCSNIFVFNSFFSTEDLNVIIKVSRNAKGIEGTSNLWEADREQPVGGKAHAGDR